MDDRLKGVGAGAAEAVVDLLANPDRFRPVRLPSGAGESCLDARGKHAEADGDHRPADEDEAGAAGGKVAEPPQGSQAGHRSEALLTPK